MSDIINQRIRDLSRSTRMLALIGASLKLRSSDAVEPAIREQIELGAQLALGGDAGALADAELTPLLTMAEMALAEGGELLRNPGRAGGWQVDNPQLLQAMGRASSTAFTRILALSETRPLLARTLQGKFLDVGTGVGGIAIKAAETCPELQVDAIDIWPPALRLAEANVAGSPYASRIQVANLDVTALEPEPRYTLVWLPTMFMARSTVEGALDRIVGASRSGGWLVASLYTTPSDTFLAVMSTLRTLRGGGEITEPAELENMLRRRGYIDIEVDVQPLATFVLGRRP